MSKANRSNSSKKPPEKFEPTPRNLGREAFTESQKFRLAGPIWLSISLFVLLWLCADHQESGLLPYYQDFALRLTHGFAPLPGAMNATTFPMWGYGFLLLLTQNVTLLCGLQFLITAGSSFYFVASLRHAGALTTPAARLAGWLLAVCLPWYAVALGGYSANSFATALLLLSLAMVFRGMSSDSAGSWRWLISSGLIYGLGLNFKSDYFFAVLLVVAYLFLFKTDQSLRCRLGIVACWIGSVAIILVPWADYSRAATGRPCWGSTNAGHVFFVGLGNLPGNTWGITTSDGDPEMHRELDKRFGPGASSFTATADSFLKRQVLEKIIAQPGEYARKCAYVAAMIPIDGFYPGVFDTQFRDRLRDKYPAASPAWILLHDWRFVVSQLKLRSVLMVLAEAEGRLFLLGGLAGMILAGWNQRRAFRHPFSLLILLIVYQLMIEVFACHLRIYLNNELVPLVCFLAWLACRYGRRAGFDLDKTKDAPEQLHGGQL